MVLVGERLLVREIVFADWYDYYLYASDEEVAKAAGFKPVTDMDIAKNLVMGFVYKGDTYVILNKETKTFLGTLNLYSSSIRKIKNVYTLGISLRKEFWGMGFGQEALKIIIKYAFEHKKATFLEIVHEPTNTRSKNMIERLGFKYQGFIDSYGKLWNGKTYDIQFYSLSKSDYEKEKKYGKNFRY